VLIGIAGAWAAFFILGRALSLSNKPEDVLTLVGLGIATGFAGKPLLKLLSRKAIEQLASETAERVAADKAREVAADKAREEVKASAPDVVRQAKEGVQATATEVATVKGGIAEDYGDSKRIIDLIELSDMDKALEGKLVAKAEDEARTVLRNEPKSAQVLIALAVVLRHKADLLPPGPDAERSKLMNEAVECCSRAIEIRQDLDWAYYNRACYTALSNGSASQVADDIRKAIELLPENKELLNDDADLAEYKSSFPEVAAALK
jgi:tetratricopeptide (TPR) repeat protein